ncbi:MAG: DMT family transporter [Elainella sp.]
MKIESAQRHSRLGQMLLAAVLWGTTGVAVRALYGLTQTNAISIGFFRLAFSAPILLLACWATLGRQMFRVRRADLAVMLLIGGLLAAYQVCYFGAIAQLGVAAATLITLCTAPVWVALLAALLLQERLTRSVLLAGSLAILGTGLLTNLQASPMPQGNPLLGALLALLSAVGYASVVLCSRRLGGRCHPLQSVTISMTAGALILLPCTMASGWVSSYSPLGWALLLYLGAVPTALAYCLYFQSMKSLSATVASIFTLFEPLTSAALAWMLFGEQLGPLGLVGALLLLSAIVLLYRAD